ncbi:MAG: D-cysteine desulfhydrase family protein [Acidimicrobiales bacterium]
MPVVAGSPLDRRIAMAHLPTPLERLDRLAAHLGKLPGTLWVKRDDLTALGGGGNKARKLEYLCADALDRGCDTLVTGGGVQSNHVRMTAAAANRLGLACTIVIAGARPDVPAGNILLDELLGPEIVWFGGDGRLSYRAVEQAIEAQVERLRGAGRRPYGMPIGGASTVGALGYVRAAHELAAQMPDVDVVVVADGSGGTHAGLLAGLPAPTRVLGVDVGARDDLDAAVPARAADAARMADLPAPPGPVWIDHDRAGPAYGVPTPAAKEALHLAARLEGLLLDPVYTGKAMAGLLAACRDGRIATAERIVFLHTGGLPALFAPPYATWLRLPG